MSNSAMIVSSDEITNEDLKKFVLSLGGVAVPEHESGFVINRGETDIWLSVQDRDFALEFYDEETLSSWRKCLRADVGSIIELQLDHSKNSHFLYLLLARRMGEVWKIALDDIDDSVVCYEELIKRTNAISGNLPADLDI